jgi:hypothetical protein
MSKERNQLQWSLEEVGGGVLGATVNRLMCVKQWVQGYSVHTIV